MLDWFIPALTDLLGEVAPVAFIIFGVRFAMDFLIDAAYGRRRSL